MHLRQPAVARLAGAERADTVGQRALDAGPQPIEMPLFVTRLARSGRSQRLVRLTRVKRELASLRLRPRAQRLRGAGLAGGRTKVDFDAVAASFVLVFAPTHAVLAGGAAHALSLPIDRKGLKAEGPLPPVLPTHVLGRGPDKVDPVALSGLHKLSGTHVGGINQMRPRGQSLAGERSMNGAGALGLVNAGRCGVDVDHQAWGVWVAGLCEVDHIARPAHLALGAKARLRVIGRLDAIRAQARGSGEAERKALRRTRCRPLPGARSAAPTPSVEPGLPVDRRAVRAHEVPPRLPRGRSRPLRLGRRKLPVLPRPAAAVCPRSGGHSARTKPRGPRHAASPEQRPRSR